MDENTAWMNFVSTGKIEDYLTYCEVKSSAQNCRNQNTEEVYENQYRRTDINRTDYR
ncbi:MAG: hypothetical protein PUG48_01810 [Clostridia bacterium]|nr:hypothetical protein [Clostridia bacterium]